MLAKLLMKLVTKAADSSKKCLHPAEDFQETDKMPIGLSKAEFYL